MSTLQNPIPLEAALQLARHLKNIRVEAGFNNSIDRTNVFIDPANRENSGISSNRKLVVNTAWDVDQCMDEGTNRTNGITSYHSKCFLLCYLFSNSDEDGARLKVRTQFHSDLVRYFWPAPGTTNPLGIDSPWCLPDENGNKVIREMYISRLNYDYDYQKKPIIKVDVELTLYWASLVGDLYTVR